MLYVYLRNWPSAQITENRVELDENHQSQSAYNLLLTYQRVDVRAERTNVRSTRRQRYLAAGPLAAEVARYARQRRQPQNTVARRRGVTSGPAVGSATGRLQTENVYGVVIGGDADARRLAVKVDAVDGGLRKGEHMLVMPRHLDHSLCI